jgi:hypothetical protein
VIKADKGRCDETGVGSEVAVQNVVGTNDVTVAVAVMGKTSSWVCTGTLVTAKAATA